MYVGGEKYLTQIRSFLDTDAFGLFVEGASGGGKSSLMARFLLDDVLKEGSSVDVAYHFCGCTSQSTDIRDLLDNVSFQV